MPMRNELAAVLTRPSSGKTDNSAWVVIAFCLVGLALALCLGVYGKSFGDLSQMMLLQNVMG